MGFVMVASLDLDSSCTVQSKTMKTLPPLPLPPTFAAKVCCVVCSLRLRQMWGLEWGGGGVCVTKVVWGGGWRDS